VIAKSRANRLGFAILLVESVTAIRLQRRAFFQAFSTREFLDIKSSGSWMLSVRVSLDGSPASVSELAGTEAIAGTVILVVEGTFSPARPPL
jgi:hypothetical protein